MENFVINYTNAATEIINNIDSRFYDELSKGSDYDQFEQPCNTFIGDCGQGDYLSEEFGLLLRNVDGLELDLTLYVEGFFNDDDFVYEKIVVTEMTATDDNLTERFYDEGSREVARLNAELAKQLQ